MRYAHITLGKAGSQWIKDVLTDPDILSLQNGVRLAPPPTGMYTMADFVNEPDGSFVGPMYHVRYDDWKRYAANTDRSIVVLRDPRDSIVSWAFSLTYSHVTEPHVQIIRPALLGLDLRGKLEIAMYTYWESSMAQRSWARKPQTDSELVLTYEEFVADQHRAFERVLQFFGWSVPEDVLTIVIDRLSFEKRSGRARGEKQDYSHYRNAMAGDWKNYFDRGLGERFEAACPELLIELGYERSPNWYERLPDEIPALSEGAQSAGQEFSVLERKIAILEEKNSILDDLARSHMESLRAALQRR